MGYKCSRGRGLNISQFLDNAKTDRTPTRGWGGVSMNRSREREREREKGEGGKAYENIIEVHPRIE